MRSAATERIKLNETKANPQLRSSVWTRMLVTGTLLFGLAAGTNAIDNKAQTPKGETKIAQAIKIQSNENKKSNGFEIVKASSTVRIDNSNYVYSIEIGRKRVRTFWDGKESTPLNFSDAMHELGACKLRKAIICGSKEKEVYKWLMACQSGVNIQALLANAIIGRISASLLNLPFQLNSTSTFELACSADGGFVISILDKGVIIDSGVVPLQDERTPPTQ